jgi:hypothetical protein
MEMSFLLDVQEQFGLMESHRSPIVQAQRASMLGGRLVALGLRTLVKPRSTCHAQLQRRQLAFLVALQMEKQDGVDQLMALGQSRCAYAKARTFRFVKSIANTIPNAKVMSNVFGLVSIA